MRPRNAAAIAATVVAAAVGTVLALGANLGLFALSGPTGPGHLRFVDGTSTTTAAPGGPPTSTTTTTRPATSSVPTTGRTAPAGHGPTGSPAATGGNRSSGALPTSTPPTTQPHDDHPLPGQDD